MNAQINIKKVVLSTNRLTLRAFRESDLNDFYEYARVDGVGQMAGWNPHRNIEESRAILTRFITAGKTFALEYDGKVIGSLGIEEYSEENYPELQAFTGREIGYVLSKDYWGMGLMPEAVRAVITYLFEDVGLDFILVGHFDRNTRSRRVIEKCGFRYIKTTRYETKYDTVEKSVEYILYNPVHDRSASLQAEIDAALVRQLYTKTDESARLTKSKAARVEFLTNVRYIERYLTKGAKILDVGAGAGEYSLYFAKRGYEVSALELSERNIAAFRQRISNGDSIDLVQGNALDLGRYADNSFDAVLLFGPLYHLHNDADKRRCIDEAKRVCKAHGKIFFAFISNDIVVLTMQREHPDYLIRGDYDKETFKLYDHPFVFHTPSHARELLRDSGIRICHEVASDGLSELIQDTVNALDNESFEQYMRYHFYLCEKPECFGMSNHLLFVGEAEE